MMGCLAWIGAWAEGIDPARGLCDKNASTSIRVHLLKKARFMNHRHLRYFGFFPLLMAMISLVVGVVFTARGGGPASMDFALTGLPWLAIAGQAALTLSVLKGYADRIDQLESRLASLTLTTPEA